jgi:hypothetical protein
VNTVYRYAASQQPSAAQSDFLQSLEKGFEASGYRLRALLQQIATSEAFYAGSQPSDQSS